MQTQIKFTVEGAGGTLAESDPIPTVKDGNVAHLLAFWLGRESIVLQAGDTIRVVEL